MQPSKSYKRKNDMILVERIGNIYKVEINDYIGIAVYDDIMSDLGADEIEDLISNSVLWNSWRQSVNKGTYYVIEDEDTVNIFVGEDKSILDIRSKIGKHTKEVVLFLEEMSTRMSRIFNDENGSTYDIKYYGNENVLVKEMEMSEKEALEEFRIIGTKIDSIEKLDLPENEEKFITAISLVKEKTIRRQ